jgi:hypothetical protein
MPKYEERFLFFSPDHIPEIFWKIIKQAGKNQKRLYEILYALDRKEIIDFEYNFIRARAQLYDEPFIEKIGIERSEDTILDICEWVVSQGKEYYSKIWKNPELIPKDVERDDRSEEILSGVAGEVFWGKFEEEIRNFIQFD